MESGAFRGKVLPNVKVNNNLFDLAILTHKLFYKANNKVIVYTMLVLINPLTLADTPQGWFKLS